MADWFDDERRDGSATGLTLVSGFQLIIAGIGVVLTLAGAGLVLAGAIRHDGSAAPRIPSLLEALERLVRVERFVYRHHRWFGGVVVLGALAALAIGGSRLEWLLGMGDRYQSPGVFLVQLTLLGLLSFLVFALVIGIYVLVRPSALKKFETIANRWIELFPDRWRAPPAAMREPRLLGALLLLFGAVCLAASALAR